MTRATRLRVMYVVPDLGVGGAERHATTLMSRLDRSRFDPSVVCIGRRGELFPALEEAGVPAVALGRTKREAFKSLVELVREFRRTSPDVVIVRGFNAELLGRVAAMVARVPHVIVWVHNCDDIEARGGLRRLSDRALEPVTRAYFGVARRQAAYMIDGLGFPEHKIRIIHNGVDPAPYASADRGLRPGFGFHDDHLVVGIVAALRPEKDHETFLRAAGLVVREVPEARFLVVGGGARREALEKLADRLGLADRVVFTGAREDVSAVLGAIDIFVLSSFTVECFPMSLLEAMASSRPAVCTAVGGVPEMVDDGVTGYLVPPKAPDALAERILDLMRSPHRCAEMGDAARTRVLSEFTLDRSVKEAERQLEEVARSRRHRVPRPVQLAVVLDETYVGGVELLMLNLFRSLDPAVVKPRLICLRAGGPLAEEFRAAGFDVEVLDRTGAFDVRTLPRLVRSLRRRRTDAVLVTHHHRAALALGRLAARLAGVRVNLVAAHDMDLTSVGKRCLPKWAVATLWESSALVLLSARQGEYLHREEGVAVRPWSRTREVVIPNGITLAPVPTRHQRDRARSLLGLQPEDFVVGIVARLSTQKAHQVLFEAVARLQRSVPRVRLVVVGGGEREVELKELAARLELQDRVQFTGIRRDVTTLLPAFDVSCLSSVHEGVPITIIEAMAAGLPVAATDCGSLRDMVTDGEEGFIVPVGDSAALATCLARLADDPALREQMGKAARLKAEATYRIEQTAHGYESLLVDLVAAR